MKVNTVSYVLLVAVLLKVRTITILALFMSALNCEYSTQSFSLACFPWRVFACFSWRVSCCSFLFDSKWFKVLHGRGDTYLRVHVATLCVAIPNGFETYIACMEVLNALKVLRVSMEELSR